MNQNELAVGKARVEAYGICGLFWSSSELDKAVLFQ